MTRTLQPSLTGRVLLSVALVGVSASLASADVFAVAHDAITTPGRSVKLGSKFERSRYGGLWRPDLRSKRVTYRFRGLSGTVRTDFDGMAIVRAPAPSAPGVYGFEAEMRSPKALARGSMWVLDPQRPLVIVDIDGTISNLPEWQVPFRGGRAKAYTGSPQLLRELASRYQIVYLTARDDTFDPQTRAFLKRRSFPAGPVIYNDLGLWTNVERRQLKKEEHGTFKLRKIQELQAMGLQVAFGIGNSETDGWAYERAGLPSYLRTEASGGGASFRFSRYATLRARLRQDGLLRSGIAGALGTP
jgi:LNS2-like protein (lipin/Ned1/Smp2)